MMAAVCEQPGLSEGAVRILVAEDDRSSRRLITALLEPLRCLVDIAENGIEAVDAVRLMRYDLVLMDLNMPKLGGVEAASAIRRIQGRRGATPIVVLTGDVFADTVERCRAAGVDEVIAKPIVEEALLGAIRKWTAGRPSAMAPAGDAAGFGGELARRLGPEILEEMAGHFREDGPRYLAEIEAALAAGRFDDV